MADRRTEVRQPFTIPTMYLAYHRADGDLARRVHRVAEELGYCVWRHFPTAAQAPGQQVRAHCGAHEARSPYMVAVASEAFASSPWLLKHVEIARELGVVVLVARTDDADLPPGLQACRSFDLRGLRAGGLHRLHGFLASA